MFEGSTTPFACSRSSPASAGNPARIERRRRDDNDDNDDDMQARKPTPAARDKERRIGACRTGDDAVNRIVGRGGTPQSTLPPRAPTSAPVSSRYS